MRFSSETGTTLLPVFWLSFPDILLSYWYILSDLAILLVAYLATWYLLNEKTSIVVMSFQITNAIFETHIQTNCKISLV